MDAFTGKIAIVTGAASGMGRELARQLATAGATVIATDIDGQALDAAIASFGSLPARVHGETLDVADAVRFRQLLEKTARDHGRIDLLFNNAGIAIYGETYDMTRAQWEKIVNVNLWGVINGTTAAYPLMIAQGSGHIVNTASAAGLAPIPMMTAYATTKHAVVGLSTSLRAEADELGVRVSVVCPGIVSTGIFDHATGLGFDIPGLRGRNPIGEVPVEKAVARILKGVQRNEGVIVFPASAKMLDLLVRTGRGLNAPFWRRAVRHFRSMKKTRDRKAG